MDINSELSEDIIILKNEHLTVELSNYGATIIKIVFKDKWGKPRDVVLGYDNLSEYKFNDAYLGATIGRYANRISNNGFTLNDNNYKLSNNNHGSTLHGGYSGFDKKVFSYVIGDDKVTFYASSHDGEEGFPGNLDFSVIYELVENKLMIRFQGESDQDTILNMTNHTYFNLGPTNNILNHYLLVNSDGYYELAENSIPTGNILPVIHSAFDFNNLRRIGKFISHDDDQIINSNGYDHYFLFNSDYDQVELLEKYSGIKVTLDTSYPGVQVYTSNALNRRRGKNYVIYDKYQGICLEAQYPPNDINLNDNSKTILRQGEVYNEYISFEFEVVKTDDRG